MASKSNSSENLSKQDNTFNAPPSNTLSSNELNKVVNKQPSSFFDRLFTIVPPQWLGSILAVFLYGFYWSFAGNLTPPAGPPTSTMHSLQDIHSIFAGNYDSSIFSADEDGNINEQLKYIMENIGGGGYEYGDSDPQYVAGTADGAGTLLVNLTHGRNTANTFDVDDWNSNGAPATGRYETSWTQCSTGNSWCGLGSNGEDVAKAMDNVTGLVWSYPCSDTNCLNMQNETATTYTHATALTNCTDGDHGKIGWRLPTYKELMLAHINGAYGNLEPQGTSRVYWSATTNSLNTGQAWDVNLSRGSTGNNSKTNSRSVRCVLSAI